ncbi:MAG TPA: ATP-binding protein [Terriglobales bacterium]|nr:ATP-binding protein [Terriglobales bacterium]
MQHVALGYGLSLLLMAAAFGLSQAFLHFHLPLPFTSFALCAIAIAFWYAGIRPGIFAAVLAAVLRFFFFEPGLPVISRLIYGLVFAIFAVLMIEATRAKNELEVRVAERTAALNEANQNLRHEIEERKRAEENLRRSETYLREAQGLSHIGSWAFNATGPVYWSEENFRIWGFDPQQGLPRRETILERIHPEDRDNVVMNVRNAVRDGKDASAEFRIVLPNGEVRYIHGVIHPTLNANGELDEVVGTQIDVTERKRAEQEHERLRQLESDLARVERITTMGELTASLAHELNQPIAAAAVDASTCITWLTRERPDVEEATQAATRIVSAATRAAEIISRVRSMFTKGTTEWSLLDVNEVVREIVRLLQSELMRHSISVQMTLGEDLPNIMGDRVQIQQVLMNLIVNSIEAMKELNGRRELAIRSQRGDRQDILVSVSDTGPGLRQGADRIFDAFFTTKPHGTGMGLRISHSIVESHGGRLWAANNSPQGAVFHLSLPAAVDTAL